MVMTLRPMAILGEIYDAGPTIVAMGRQPEFDRMISMRYWQRFQIWHHPPPRFQTPEP
jgi:hypothetical protein